MKNLIIIVVLSVVCIHSFAQIQNPQMRICKQLQGQFFSVAINNDEVGMCQIGHSKIGTIDLLKYFYENINTFSVESFLNQNKTCSNGQIVTVNMENGPSTSFCLFNDYSIIDLASLEFSGLSQTSELQKALTKPLQ